MLTDEHPVSIVQRAGGHADVFLVGMSLPAGRVWE